MQFEDEFTITIGNAEHDTPNIETVLRSNSTLSSITNTYAWSTRDVENSRNNLTHIKEERNFDIEEDENGENAEKNRYMSYTVSNGSRQTRSILPDESSEEESRQSASVIRYSEDESRHQWRSSNMSSAYDSHRYMKNKVSKRSHGSNQDSYSSKESRRSHRNNINNKYHSDYSDSINSSKPSKNSAPQTKRYKKVVRGSKNYSGDQSHEDKENHPKRYRSTKSGRERFETRESQYKSDVQSNLTSVDESSISHNQYRNEKKQNYAKVSNSSNSQSIVSPSVGGTAPSIFLGQNEEETDVGIAVEIDENDQPNRKNEDHSDCNRLPNLKSLLRAKSDRLFTVIRSNPYRSKKRLCFLSLVIIALALLFSILLFKKPLNDNIQIQSLSPTQSILNVPSLKPTSLSWKQVGSDLDGPGVGATFLNGSKMMSVSMSDSGTRVAVGYPGFDQGLVQVYEEKFGSWIPLGEAISSVDIGDRFVLNNFGTSVSLSPDGNFVAVSNPFFQVLGVRTGSVTVFRYFKNSWGVLGTPIHGINQDDEIGKSISLSNYGKRIAIGVPNHDARKVLRAGQVRIYELENVKNVLDWIFVGLPINGYYKGEEFGTSISLSNDGKRIAIGVPKSTRDGAQGLVVTYDEMNGDWEQTSAFISGTSPAYYFGRTVTLSSDGQRLAIGADLLNERGEDVGQIEIYGFQNNVWEKLGTEIIGQKENDITRSSISLSSDGSNLAIGTPLNNKHGTATGRAQLYHFVSGYWTQIGPDIFGYEQGFMAGDEVSLSGDGSRIAIGSPGADKLGAASGMVKVLDLAQA